MKRIVLVLFCLCVLCASLSAAQKGEDKALASSAERPTVQVTGGEVRGVVKDGIASFKGIPFAAPPVGELRWRAPQPVVPWEGVREADQFGPPPMQMALATLVYGSKPSEDCLHINVWTAAKEADERRPVMVWIYGGAFNGGGAGDAIFDGTHFAKKGVVLVTFNYRIGVFGFLAHPELSAESGQGSGCYGIQDQIAALRWVKENIAQFGGDPSRVTIFGQSAGGISVSILTQSPPARGLFHRAISQSGGSMAPVKTAADQANVLVPSLALAEQMGKAFLYYFDYGPKPGEVGHGAEVRYVFGNLGGLLFRTAKSYWGNFAAQGNPNGPGSPPWPAIDDQTMSAMVFGKTPQAGPTPNLEKLKAFDVYYARLRESPVDSSIRLFPRD